jgi:hypothetical protein
MSQGNMGCPNEKGEDFPHGQQPEGLNAKGRTVYWLRNPRE